jgi:glycosyltransferase involved in cell wall biosynthesis
MPFAAARRAADEAEGRPRAIRMPARLAYLIGGRIPAAPERDWSRQPCPEYALFAQRNEVSLLDFSHLQATSSSSSRLFARRGAPHIGLALAAAKMHRDYDAYLVSGEDVGLPLALSLRLLGRTTPVYVITHGSYFGSPKFRWLMRVVRRMKQVHFLCLAESLCTALSAKFGMPCDQVHNTGYGVDTDFFRPPSEPIAGPLIVSAGTATRDYRTLVRAVDGMSVPVKIAADSAWFPTATDLAGETVPANVEARSYGNYRALRDLYAAASFVVVPLYPAEHACGFAVMIEAMAMGKAVIATRTAAHSDFIVEGETGTYVPPGDAEALRSAIHALLAQPELARAMGLRARRLVEERYSLAEYCARIEAAMALPGD